MANSQIEGASLAPFFQAMTETIRDTLTPPNGTVILNTTSNKLNVRLNGGWEAITSA